MTIIDLVMSSFDIRHQPSMTAPPAPAELREACASDEVGLIVGPSGSGKSTSIVDIFGKPSGFAWNNDISVVEHFSDYESAVRFLGVAGLNSVPQWMKPYAILSTGEKARADLAIGMSRGERVFDEFTSTVSRTVAKSMCYGLNRLRLPSVFATCHYDVSDWLEWDWCFDFGTGKLVRSADDHEHDKVTWRLLMEKDVSHAGTILRF